MDMDMVIRSMEGENVDEIEESESQETEKRDDEIEENESQDNEKRVDEIEENESQENEKRVKRRKPGILYLSRIPPNMHIGEIRKYFSNYGQLNRVFLQPLLPDPRDERKHVSNVGKEWTCPKGYCGFSNYSTRSSCYKCKTPNPSEGRGKRRFFTEGWIEFKSKRKAKKAYVALNCEPVGGKRRNQQHSILWNLKYLPRFKWAYLKERLAYEREVHRQRMNIQASQVCREADHYAKASDRRQIVKKKEIKYKIENSKNNNGNESDITGFVFKQKLTSEEIQKRKEAERIKKEKNKKRKQEKKKKKQKRVDDLIDSIFDGSKKQEPVDDLIGSIFVGSK